MGLVILALAWLALSVLAAFFFGRAADIRDEMGH